MEPSSVAGWRSEIEALHREGAGPRAIYDWLRREKKEDFSGSYAAVKRMCRRLSKLALRLRRASFDNERTLDDFDFSFNPQLPKSQIIDLATCSFIARHENVLLIGPTGVGKSHIAQSLGHRACRQGHSVLYTSAHDMLTELRRARADQTYERRLLRYTNPALLVIDDLGLRPLKHEEPMDLYEIVRHRYERSSTIFTSNRSVEEWGAIFRDDLLASAAVDRILHNAHVLVMDGDTYRNPPAGRGRPTRPAANA